MATNPWFTAAQQTLPEHVPLPMQELFQAGQVLQNRFDTNIANMDSVGTGLASIEALAPAHSQYVSTLADNYRQESSDLLDKYSGNAADPQFQREFSRLRNKYANDPNLGVIGQANQGIKAKQKAIQDISSKGGRYIDTNPSFTGVDQSGRLTYDPGQVRMTTFESDLQNLFSEAAKSVTDDGNLSTNRPALDQIMQSIVSGIGTNPITLEALQYYSQQGYSPEEAIGQLQNDLGRLYNTYLTNKKVDTNERLALARQSNTISAMNAETSRMNYNLSARKYSDEQAEKAFANSLLPQTSPIEARNANASLISQVDQLLNLYDNTGKIKSGKYQIADNPQNRERYPNARPVSSSAGVGAPGQNFLEINTANVTKENKEFIQAAKEIVDPNNRLSDKQTLDAYKIYLQQDNNAPTFWNTPIKENRDNIVRNYIGDKGENLRDAIYIDQKGRTKRVADGDVDLNSFKSFDFGGITSSPINTRNATIEGGAMKITAINDKGEAVMFMKPLDPTLQSLTGLSNLVSKAAISGITDTQIRKSPEYLRQIDENTVVAPQRTTDGSVVFYQIINGERYGQPIDPTPYIQQENARVGQFFGAFKNR